MIAPAPIHVEHILRRLRQVQQSLGQEPAGGGAEARLADEVDSMGLVELVALLADDCGVRPEAIERAVAHRFGTVGELADGLASAGLAFRSGAVAGQPALSATAAEAMAAT